MNGTAYCDIFIKTQSSQNYQRGWKWCGHEMQMIDGKWVCPKHGEYADAILTLPHGSYSTLPQEVL